jgi:hypothetical protein
MNWKNKDRHVSKLQKNKNFKIILRKLNKTFLKDQRKLDSAIERCFGLKMFCFVFPSTQSSNYLASLVPMFKAFE